MTNSTQKILGADVYAEAGAYAKAYLNTDAKSTSSSPGVKVDVAHWLNLFNFSGEKFSTVPFLFTIVLINFISVLF